VFNKSCLLERVSTTLLALPCLCLITYQNCLINSTHLICLLLSVLCPFKCLRESLSLWITNSL